MTATNQLESSRALLRRALLQSDTSPRSASVLDSIAAGMAGDSAGALQSLASAWVESTVAPIVRDKPLQALGAAAVAGALLVYVRPWRCGGRGSITRMLLPLIMTRLLASKTKP